MNINLSKKEIKRLKEAMNRVSNEISLHSSKTSTDTFEQFLDDLSLILCELHIILRQHRMAGFDK